MLWWKSLNPMGRRLAYGGLGLLVCLVVVACTMMAPRHTDSSSADRVATRTDGQGKSTPSTPDTGDVSTPGGPADKPIRPKAPSRRPDPLSAEAIASARARIGATEDYGARIEARRSLIYPLCRAGQLDVAVTEFDALLDDVENHEGHNMAERVALADGDNLRSRKEFGAAMLAYGRLLDRWPEGRFTAEALFQKGACHLDVQEYAQAEHVWQRLIEEHDASTYAPWAWRKLALAQLLQSKPDESLATLEVMAAKYDGTSFGDYARMRRGYVQMVTGRLSEARESHMRFLVERPGSKYCQLAKGYLEQIDGHENLAAANSQGS